MKGIEKKRENVRKKEKKSIILNQIENTYKHGEDKEN